MLRDVLVGIAAATTAIVAVVGLKNWSRELRGKTNFEVARQFIRATYNVRDQIQYARSPLYGANEFPPEYEPMAEITAQAEAEAWSHVLGNRWEPVREALQEFEAHTLEAEALWGANVKAAAQGLRQCARELQIAMEATVQDKLQRGENFRTDKEFGQKMRSTVAASVKDDDNELTRKVSAAVEKIEELVQPHLPRS